VKKYDRKKSATVLNYGARAIAMGEAFTPVADDASALYWNPAGLTKIEGTEVILHTSSWPAGLSHQFVGYVFSDPRLPGSAGIADVTLFNERCMLYVPRHSRAVFVVKVDFVSGLGHTPDRPAGAGPRYCITNLGQFDFAGGVMRLVTVEGDLPSGAAIK
jgi:hypothetical protein